LAASARGTLARRAAHLHLASCGSLPSEMAKGWLVLAELELSLGNTGEAREALVRSLIHDPGAIPALILAAVLADQRGDTAEAITHLETIEARLKQMGAPSEGPTGEAVLRRQLVALYERAGRDADAAAMWARILADHPQHLPHRAEHASWLLRKGRTVDAQQAAAELLPLLPSAGEAAVEVQRLLKELALLAALVGGQQGGARAAIAVLTAHEARLGLGNRLVLAQFALLVEDVVLATRQLDAVDVAEPGNRIARTLRVRLATLRRDQVGAEHLARALWQDQRDDQDAAALLGECLAQAGRPGEALVVLDEAAAGKPTLDAGLLAALVACDHLGEAAALARLGRITPPATSSAIVRVLAAAWPGAWALSDSTQPATISDLHHLPALPGLATHLSAALGRAGQHELASALLLLVASAVADRGAGQTARRLRTAAVIPLMAAGERRRALAAAWAARSFVGVLRCLRPW
jgi:tetratricopeptide (TPR) repeat protein